MRVASFHDVPCAFEVGIGCFRVIAAQAFMVPFSVRLSVAVVSSTSMVNLLVSGAILHLPYLYHMLVSEYALVFACGGHCCHNTFLRV